MGNERNDVDTQRGLKSVRKGDGEIGGDGEMKIVTDYLPISSFPPIPLHLDFFLCALALPAPLRSNSSLATPVRPVA